MAEPIFMGPPRCITESRRLEMMEKEVSELKKASALLLQAVKELQEDILKIKKK